MINHKISCYEIREADGCGVSTKVVGHASSAAVAAEIIHGNNYLESKFVEVVFNICESLKEYRDINQNEIVSRALAKLSTSEVAAVNEHFLKYYHSQTQNQG